VNFNIPPATQALLLVNVLAHFLIMLVGGSYFVAFPLYPVGAGFAPWQLVTYGFLHADNWHLLLNMFMLFMFGGEIERLFGSRWFLIYYFVCLISAAITQLIVAAVAGGPYGATVGASGAIFGLLLAFGMYFPRRQIQLLIPPIPMPAWAAVTLFGVIELVFGVTGTMSNVAHFAHLGGMVGGFFMIMHRRGKWPRRRR
jgi:membrane associated rhomboid family serine protease